MACYAAASVRLVSFETCFSGPISPNLYWGKQKLGVSGGHLMPVAMGDSMGHWMGDAVGHLVGGGVQIQGHPSGGHRALSHAQKKRRSAKS